jgi:hypothetical protein
MKKFYTTLVILITCYCSYAQTIGFPSNVVISTSIPAAHDTSNHAIWFANGTSLMAEKNSSIPGIGLTANVVHTSTPGGYTFANSAYPAWQMGMGYGSYDGFGITRSAAGTYAPKSLFTIIGNGNVGIGTAAPVATLEVYGSNSTLKVNSNDNETSTIRMAEDAGDNNVGFFMQYKGASNTFSIGRHDPDGTNPADDLPVVNILRSNGNVGIGTDNPYSTLDVYAPNSTLKVSSDDDNTSTIRLSEDKGDNFIGFYMQYRGAINTFSIGRHDPDSNNPADDAPVLNILRSNGNVGIGTASPDAALAVNGTIHSKEVKVDLSVPAPDYVFDKDYELRALNDLKAYLAKYHHLPEIPSAAEIAKNGLNLGEMDTQLLKKVEELTLYLIEKDKQATDQEKRIEKLEQQLNSLLNK